MLGRSLFATAIVGGRDNRIDIARFSQGDLSGWRPNPLTSNALMITVEPGTDQVEKWIREKSGCVDAVALIANTGTTATNWYGDI